jgi:hypothetical protein
MSGNSVRLVTFAWGRDYLDNLLDFALPAALAPGNLPALAAVFDCTVAIVTEDKLFNYVRAHPIIKKLEQVCPVALVPLDDLVSDPWQYGITLAYALFRGFADLGPAMTDTYILFLNADFILADGCYAKLIDRIRSAERVHLAPSYCTVEEQLRPLLRKAKKQNAGILAIPPRKMAELILAHSHNTIRAKTVNQSVFEFEYADQFYSKVDAHTLIGHQMPIALIGMRPERQLTDLNTFWDWGIVYELCPSQQLTVIGDSDDFLIMELRHKDRSMDSILLGRSPPKQVARRLMGHITQYQVDNAQFELLLHSHALPSDLAEARRELRAHVDHVLRHLRSVPNYRRHPQWLYHLRHFPRRLERQLIRSLMTRIREEMEQTEADFNQEYTLIDEYLSDDERELALKHSEAACADKLDGFRRALARREAELKLRIPSGERIFRRIAGMSWAYRVSRRRLRIWLRQVANDLTYPILAVCPGYSRLLGILEPTSGLHMHLTPESVAEGALSMLPKGRPDFDCCLVELSDVEAPGAAELIEAIAARLKKPGTMLIHWHDQGTVPLRSVHNQIVQFALDRGCQASAHYAGSWASAKAARAFQQARQTSGWRRLFPSARLPALAVLAELRERARRNELTTIPKYCSSAVFKIEMPSEEIVKSAAPIGSRSQKAKVINTRPRPKTPAAAWEIHHESSAMAALPGARPSRTP